MKYSIIHPDDLLNNLKNEIIERKPPPESIKHLIKKYPVRIVEINYRKNKLKPKIKIYEI